MHKARDYLEALRQGLGRPGMSDRELGAFLGVTQQAVSKAKARGLSSDLALMVGLALARMGLVGHAGEVVLACELERELGRRSMLGEVMRDYWRTHALPGVNAPALVPALPALLPPALPAAARARRAATRSEGGTARARQRAR